MARKFLSRPSCSPVAAPRRFTLAAALLFTSLAWLTPALEPPKPGEMERYRLDGTLAQRQAFARSLGNQTPAPGLAEHGGKRVAALASGSPEAANTPPSAWKGMPTTGTVKILALLLSFSDYPSGNEAATVDSQLFGDGDGSGYPYESLRNFYRRSSYDQLELTGSTLGWYTPSYPRDSVSQSTDGRESLIREALNSFNTQGHDFSQYDNDGDGVIDYFVVVWTGPDNGWGNFWWGYQTGFWDDSYLLDGKRLGAYSWQWESNPYPGSYDPNVVIHETGHALGLPDYYDYDGSRGPDGGVGGLDMMDAAWGDHNCFSKFILDWITPTVVTSGATTRTLGASSSHKDALIVMPGSLRPDGFDEYFMIQSRDRDLNDIEYPEDGLLVWHVDARVRSTSWGYDYVYDNSYTSHKLLRLMEADGLEEIEKDRWADPGDYYTSASTFGPSTVPSSKRYDGTATDLLLDQIVTGGATSTLRITLPGGSDDPPSVTIDSPAPGATVTGMVTIQASASDDRGIAKVELYVDGAFVSEMAAPPFTFLWDTTGYPVGPHTLKVEATDTADQTDSEERSIFLGTPPSVTSMKKQGSPFRIAVSGSGFQAGATVSINGDPWPEIKFKGTTSLVIKGGSSLKAKVPAGTPATFVITNPDGGAVTHVWQY